MHLADQALCVVGALDSERRGRYGPLVRDGQREMNQFLRDFSSAMKPFGFRKPATRTRPGPYRLPARMDVAVLAETPMRVRSTPWTVTVLDVRAPGDAWVNVDDRGLPT